MNHAGTRLFVATTEQDSLPVMRVYDANTLALLGRLVVPVSQAVPCLAGGCWQGTTVLDEASGTVYFANPGDPVVSYEFDILAEP